MLFMPIFSISLGLGLTGYGFYNGSKISKLSAELENQKTEYNTLMLLYDRVRGYKHDIGNILQSIGGYILTDNISGLKTYYKQLEEDYHLVKNLSILSPDIINNPALYSLISAKYKKAEDLGIKVNLEICLDLSDLNINIYEFTRILGIILDNAIEASNQSKEKFINFIIRKDSHVNRNLFIIENSYSNKDVNTDKIFEKGYTSKEDHDSSHGLGLWEVRKILNTQDNLNLFTAKNDKFFIQQLEIYNHASHLP